ncbi:MAG TPA: hypothetical protein PK031_07640 [Pseudomonadales bacterium]|nr:hypothetical protein [Pseudomonadales bacterium]
MSDEINVEKLIYLFWKPEDIALHEWHQQISDQLIPVLRNSGATRFRLNLPDDAVAKAHTMRMTHQPPLPDALLSFWVNSASQRHNFETSMRAMAARIAGYCVSESEPLPNTLHPVESAVRGFGMNHVVFLSIPERLDREQWLNLWLDQHTAVAIDTQQNFGYRQNIVWRALHADGPLIDAIVEENFPPEAISDQNAFYRPGTAEQVSEHQKRMYQSCKQFIDFDKMGRLPTSEYNFN